MIGDQRSEHGAKSMAPRLNRVLEQFNGVNIGQSAKGWLSCEEGK